MEKGTFWLYYSYVVIAFTMVLGIIQLMVFAPKIPTYLQDELAGLIEGSPMNCSTYPITSLPEACRKASDFAPIITAVLSLMTSLLGMILNPLIGYLSDIIGRKCLLIFLNVLPLLSTEKRERVLSILSLITMIGTLAAPLLSLLDSKIICYILFFLRVILIPLLCVLPQRSHMNITESIDEIKKENKNENMWKIIGMALSKEHFILLYLFISLAISSCVEAIINNTLIYFLQTNLGLNDTDRSISLILMSISFLLYIGIIFPLSRKYKSLPYIYTFAIAIHVPLPFIQSILPSKWIYFVVSFFFSGLVMFIHMIPTIFIGDTVPTKHQGIIQGILTSSNTIGTALGTIFTIFAYTKIELLGGLWIYVPFLLVSIIASISLGFAFMFNRANSKVLKEKEDVNQLLIPTEV
ncbi:hypothetical protein WA158_000525 [Blastocystis sp. Blastoise]